MGRNARGSGDLTMTHAAGSEFFNQKRPWSTRKDRILGSYLTAYLPKVATQRLPILIVDGFAGPGKFLDGSPGSPFIIARTIQSSGKDAKLWAIEANEESAAQLARLLEKFQFVTCRHAEFVDTLPDILTAIESHSVFLYLDPFAIKGLSLESLVSIFEWVHRRRSVEVLINFNATAFARCARAALKTETGDEPDDEQISRSVTHDELNSFAGGDWWRPVVLKKLPFAQEVSELVTGYCGRLREHFSEVCFHEIREHINHVAPKYVLVFASRHPHALLLMNDEMVKSRDHLVDESRDRAGMLFEMAPLKYVPNPDELDNLVPDFLTERMSRGDLILKIVRSRFGRFSTGQMRKSITQQIKMGRIQSITGKSRINDTIAIWKT